MINYDIFIHYCPTRPYGVYLSSNTFCLGCYVPKKPTAKVVALAVPNDQAAGK